MAEAVLHLWPDAKVAIGPAIADGFYYDFEFPEPISSDDLERIEQEMRRILAQRAPVRAHRRRRQGRDPGPLPRRRQQPYKLELARDLPDGEISLYTQDGFEDLCRGPHLQTHQADQGLQAALDGRRLLARRLRQPDADPHLRHRLLRPGRRWTTHLERLEEARRRDHRRLGRELDLFHFSRRVAGLAVLASARDGDLERADHALARAEPRARLPGGAHPDPLQRATSGSGPATGRTTARTCTSPRSRRASSASSR